MGPLRIFSRQASAKAYPAKLHATLYRELLEFLPASRVLQDPVSTLACGGDASFYRLIPKLVIKALTEKEAALVLSACHRLCLPVTFRAAGTSLSGQAISDSVLLQIGMGFNSAKVLDEGMRIRLQPAVTGASANRLLAPHGRKLGPDPASIDAAMIGGIAANNASGMCCGTAQNCYRTLESMRMVCADGTILDTSDPASREAFAGTHREMLEGLSHLAAEVQGDADLKALISRKYTMKNTTGYSLNALVDFHDPYEILQHLLIGSEGTLGFISQITLHTVPDPRHKSAILAFFPDADTIGRAVRVLEDMQVQAVEYMDEASLLSVAHHQVIAAVGVLPSGCSALLIDIRADRAEELQARLVAVQEALSGFLSNLAGLGSPIIAARESDYQSLWAIRKGLFPAIGALRPPGATIIIEDVAFPVDRLSEALTDLRGLLNASGYATAIIYGHALFGNLHFVFWQDFGKPSEVERYAAFMEKMAGLVIGKYGGSLKAEHGTGRNMAPFVEREWGSRAYAAMIRIKALFDPRGILNPDVILSADKRIHLKNLKPLPVADPLIDKCIECGFCEGACPSRHATLTPRQRISVWREISRLRFEGGGGRRLQALIKGFGYQGEQTCATDGMCALKCPVGIDTGLLIKSIRKEAKNGWQNAVADRVARHFGIVLQGTRFALRLLQAVRNLPGVDRVSQASQALTRLVPGMLPPGLAYLPRPGKALPASPLSPSFLSLPASGLAPRVLYFPSCINRAFGPERPEDPPLSDVMVTLLRRAGFEVRMPAGANGLCCGLAFASKGFSEQGDAKLREARAALELQGGDAFAIVCDTSPCTQRLVENLDIPMTIQDSVIFLESEVLPRLQVRKRKAAIALHPTCSMTRMGLTRSLETLASACAEKVVVPDGIPCCGVAGDRIFLHPELPLSACASLRNTLPKDCGEGYSNSRTCEIGLTHASGIPYRSILYLLNEATA